MLYHQPMTRRLSRFFGKILPPKVGGDFFKNPEGLTLTDGKRNGYLCILFFSYKELTSNLRGTQIKCVNTLQFN